MKKNKTDWLKPIDIGLYKAKNRSNWGKNVAYWTTQPLRHVVDNYGMMRDIVDNLVTDDSTVIDIGCGSGFLYQMIREKSTSARYVGMDFNNAFIEKLASDFGHDPNAEFVVQDLDQEIPDRFINKADVVFSLFVFLEMESLASAYKAGYSLLKSGGIFSIFTIEYTHLILAVSHGMADFKANLKKYQKIRAENSVPYTFQKIDLGDGESDELTYGSVFHSTADYVSAGLHAGLHLERFLENIHTDKYHPKVYQYFEFKKS
jgi:SAM-dependent methyltransferase